MKFIVNADDYGLNKSCTEAIIRAFQANLITDTTACANGAYIDEAMQLAKQNNIAGNIGIHFNITAGQPLTEAMRSSPTFCDNNGNFILPKKRAFIMSAGDKKILYDELVAQAEKLRSYGINITHADSHHHIHTGLAYAGVFRRAIRSCGIKKVRIMRNAGEMNKVKLFLRNLFNRTFYHKHFITASYFGSLGDMEFVNADKTGVSEVMVHPDHIPDSEIIIDRVTRKDGIPVGKELRSLSEYYPDKHIEYISYSKLA